MSSCPWTGLYRFLWVHVCVPDHCHYRWRLIYTLDYLSFSLPRRNHQFSGLCRSPRPLELVGDRFDPYPHEYPVQPPLISSSSCPRRCLLTGVKECFLHFNFSATPLEKYDLWLPVSSKQLTLCFCLPLDTERDTISRMKGWLRVRELLHTLMDNVEFFFSSAVSQSGVTWFLELHSEHLKGNLFRLPWQSFVLCLVLVHSVHKFNSLHLACLVWALAYVEQRHFCKVCSNWECCPPSWWNFPVQRRFYSLPRDYWVFFLAWIGIIPFGVKIIFFCWF